MSDDDVTRWIRALAKDDQTAAQRIWERYYQTLVRLARKKLGDSDRRVADEEDVALSAIKSFCRGLKAGRFPRLDDRQDLWRLLVALTARKAVDHLRRQHAQKRGGGGVRGESVFIQAGSSEQPGGIDAVLGAEPTADFAAQVAEQCEALLGCLDDDRLRQTALYKLEGYTNQEIAQTMDCAESTVERRLARIRRKWGEGTQS